MLQLATLANVFAAPILVKSLSTCCNLRNYLKVEIQKEHSMADSIRIRVARMLHLRFDVRKNAQLKAAMSQAIREIDSTINEVGAGLCRAATEKHVALCNLATQNRRHEQIVGEMSSALKEGRDDLAKVAIEKRFELEAQISLLEKVIANTAEDEKEMESHLIALHAKKREMEETLRQFTNATHA
jgi:phage shock protein A